MLAIRSSDRASGTPSKFRIRLQQPIMGEWECVHCLIPNSIYTVRADCNEVRILVDGMTHTLSLSVGFHDVSTLVDALQALLSTAADNTFAVAYDSLTARVTIANANGFQLLWAGLNNSLEPVLGFAEIDTSVATAHTATGTIELTRRHLSFNIVVGPSDSGITDTKGRHSTFLISNTEDSLGYVAWDSAQSYRQCVIFRSPTRELTISLQDATFQDVDLNGGEWFMLWRPTIS